MARLDRDTFEQLVRLHHAGVHRSALRIAGQPDVAADVVQDVFVRVLEGKVDLRAAESPGAVLCWLATRLAHNARRAAGRRRIHEENAAMQRNPNCHSYREDQREHSQAILSRVDELPDELRLPLLLYYQDRLTFAAVGSALAIGESTAHERVQRALQRLRSRVSTVGVALADLEVADALGRAAPQPPPAGLLVQLLALAEARHVLMAVGAKLAVAAVALVACVALVLAGTGAASPAGGGPAASVATGIATSSAAGAGGVVAGAADGAVRWPAAPPQGPPAPPQGPPAPPAPQDPQDPRQRTPAGASGAVAMLGSVVDAEAVAVPGVRVQAVTAGGLKPFELAATTTDERGAFALEVPGNNKYGASVIRLVVRHGPRELLATAERAIAATTEPLELRLPREAGLQSERFELAVTVRDARGRPVADVPVVLYARPADAPAPLPGQAAADAHATTDAAGKAHLDGRIPGAQMIFVDGRKVRLPPRVVEAAAAPGSAGHVDVALAEPAELRAQIDLVDGGVPQWANVWVVDEATQLWFSGKLQGDGSVTIGGLGAGPFTLRVEAHPFSPVAMPGLVPGGEPVEVRLKQHDDERDVGDHMAELHGRLVDAATGETVEFEALDVAVRPVVPGASTWDLDRIERPRPVQVMADSQKRERFHLAGLAAGTWGIVANRPGYAPGTAIVTVRERELRTDVEVRMHRAATIAGTVVDPAGQPVASAMLAFVGVGDLADRAIDDLAERAQASAAEPGRRAGSRLRSDEAGRFELSGVPPFVEVRVIAVVPAADGSSVRRGVSAAFALQPGERRSGVTIQLR